MRGITVRMMSHDELLADDMNESFPQRESERLSGTHEQKLKLKYRQLPRG